MAWFDSIEDGSSQWWLGFLIVLLIFPELAFGFSMLISPVVVFAIHLFGSEFAERTEQIGIVVTVALTVGCAGGCCWGIWKWGRAEKKQQPQL